MAFLKEVLLLFVTIQVHVYCQDSDSWYYSWGWNLFKDAWTDNAPDTNSTISSFESANVTGESDEVASSEYVELSYDEMYTPWGDWTTCNARCRQHRIRHCRDSSVCGSNKLKEMRSCFEDSCPDHEAGSLDKSSQQRKANPEYFSEWSPWSRCTRTCYRRRHRTCIKKHYCRGDVITEQAECAPGGSACEQMILANQNYTRGSMNQLPSECGLSDFSGIVSTRIYGGRESNPGKWPWQVALLNRFKEQYCGGVLIAPEWVLTAAHCVKKRSYAMINEHDLYSREGGEKMIKIEKPYVHPDYDVNSVDNDIALLRLRVPVYDGKFICLPPKRTDLPSRTRCAIVGWGKENEQHKEGATVLHEAFVPLVPRDICVDEYEGYLISKNMMCAGYRNGRADSCSGDSGGPLMCEIDGKWSVYGVTSFGRGCGLDGRYGIYGKVPNFVKWIKLIMKTKTASRAGGIRYFLNSVRNFLKWNK